MRALLGIFESCLFPGAAYLIACWYPRKQMARRSAAFYITSIAVGGEWHPSSISFREFSLTSRPRKPPRIRYQHDARPPGYEWCKCMLQERLCRVVGVAFRQS